MPVSGSRVTRHASLLFIVIMATTAMAGELAKEEGFVPVFDGKTLNGWSHHNEPGHGGGARWEVRDGAIAGVQEWPEAWGMLATKQAFGDFELRLEVKAEWPIDSGILVRATGEGRGYEVSLHCRPDGDVGGLAGARTDAPQAAARDWAKAWKKGEWNELRVVVRGRPPTIQTWLNGTAMAELKDDAKRVRVGDSGRIGLEIHGSREAFGNRILFRNLRILELK